MMIIWDIYNEEAYSFKESGRKPAPMENREKKDLLQKEDKIKRDACRNE